MSIEQYDSLAENYSELIIQDPAKKYLQYPEAIRLLGNIHGKLLLDIGCGDGYFTSVVAKKGAMVVGYDSSSKQIELAKKREGINMKFFCSNQYDFIYTKKFDKAFSNMVLFYAVNYSELAAFFMSAFKNLKNRGEFLGIIINPDFSKFGKMICNRKLWLLPGNKMKSEFFINGKYAFSSEYSYFSRRDYETAAIESGFKDFSWKEMKVTSDGVKAMGKDFWENYNKYPIYAAFIAKKYR